MPDPIKPDDTAKPAQTDADVVKDAVPAGRGELPQTRKLTLSQQVFIWSMIIIVGVLFGAGSVFDSFLGPSSRGVGGVSETELLVRQRTYANVNRAISGSEGQPVPFERIADQLNRSRLAMADGLDPSSRTVDLLVDDFLAQPLPGDSTKATYGDRLRDGEGGRYAVSRADLERMLREEAAWSGYRALHEVVPAIPRRLGEDLLAISEQVEVSEAVLDASHLLPTVAVKDDDAEIQATFERLKARRFTKPAAVVVTIAGADPKDLRAGIAIDDAAAQAYYDAHRNEFPKALPPPKPGEDPPPSEPRPFAEVKAEIVEKLVGEQAARRAEQTIGEFSAQVEEKGLDIQPDNAGFKALATSVAGLAVREDVTIEQPSGVPFLQIGEFGFLKDDIQLFTKDAGFVSLQLKTFSGAWIVLRIDRKVAPTTRELAEVRQEVKDILAAERVWKPFLAAAEEARAAVDGIGPGGLATYLASPAGTKWKATASPAPAPLSQLDDLEQPGETADTPRSDRLPVASLLLPQRPAALAVVMDRGGDPRQRQREQAHRFAPGELPKVRLLQVSGLKAPQPAIEAKDLTSFMRRLVKNYRTQLFNGEVASKLSR